MLIALLRNALTHVRNCPNFYMVSTKQTLASKLAHRVLMGIMTLDSASINAFSKIQNSTGWTESITCVSQSVLYYTFQITAPNPASIRALLVCSLIALPESVFTDAQ